MVTSVEEKDEAEKSAAAETISEAEEDRPSKTPATETDFTSDDDDLSHAEELSYSSQVTFPFLYYN